MLALPVDDPKTTEAMKRQVKKLVLVYVECFELVDSGASHSFVAAKLVEKYQLTVNLGTNTVVTLADVS